LSRWLSCRALCGRRKHGRHGYEIAGEGKNGFLCMVERSWTAGIDDPDFWNPKLRAPICFNPPAARTHLPITVKKTELILPTLESGAMCYMMSKQGYLSDRDGHWHPHLMFFVPETYAPTWGADLPGSPVIEAKDPEERLIMFLIPVGKWSDGTAAPAYEQ
jgi:hypothetical protein